MNVVPISTAKPDPGSPLDYALRYAAIGWYVFPVWGAIDGACRCGKPDCKSPGKHPAGHLATKGHESATIDPGTIKQWWAQFPEAGIGVHLARSGLVAVDIDPRNGGLNTLEQIEAVHGELNSEVMALTQGGGEHRVFSLPLGSDIGPTLGDGIDLKRNGYIVVEPTRGIKGCYAWVEDYNPLNGAVPAPLPDWALSIARVKFQHDYSAAQIGERAVSEGTINDLRDALPFIPSDDRYVWIRIGLALKQIGDIGFELWDNWSKTSSKYNAADCVEKWQTLKPASISYETVLYEAAKNGWVNPLKGGAPNIDAVDIETVKPFIPPSSSAQSGRFLAEFPVAALRECSRWMAGLSEDPTHEITQAGVIGLASVVTGRLYRSTNANWPSLLMVVSGHSGAGKNYIKTGIERILLRSDLSQLISGDFYTHQAAIYSTLRHAPCHICISDEFGENFMEARKNNNSNKLTVFKALKKAYSDCDHIFKTENYALSKNREAEDLTPVVKPALTLVGLTTPAQLYSEIKTSHIESGLVNRFIIVDVKTGWQVPNSERRDDVPQEIIEMVQRVRRVNEPLRHTAHDLEPNYVTVPISPGADRLFSEFKKEQTDRSNELEPYNLDALPRRWRENAMRLSTALAPWADPDSPVITEEIAQFAVNYVRHWGNTSIETIREIAYDSEYQQRLSTVFNLIKALPEGISSSKLAERIKSIKPRDRNEILNHLFEAGRIQKVRATAGPAGGRPTERWIAVESEDDE